MLKNSKRKIFFILPVVGLLCLSSISCSKLTNENPSISISTTTKMVTVTQNITKSLTSTTTPIVSSTTTKTTTYITPSTTATTPQVTEALVTRVVDGDTIEVRLNGLIYKVRYIGINTPETVDPDRPVERMGVEASNKNKELVSGQFVRLEKDVSETDSYGRLLRYVYVGDLLSKDSCM